MTGTDDDSEGEVGGGRFGGGAGVLLLAAAGSRRKMTRGRSLSWMEVQVSGWVRWTGWTAQQAGVRMRRRRQLYSTSRGHSTAGLDAHGQTGD